MKVLVVSQHYYPENFRITDICETLVKMGHDITVICGYPNYPEGYIYSDYRGKNKKKHKDEVINGVSIHRCFEIARGHSSFKLFLNYYSVCLSMKRKAKRLKEQFDCVFVNQTSPVMVGWAGIAYARKHHVPCYLYCYDLWPASLAAGGIKKKSIVYKIFNRVSRKVYQRANRVLVTSKSFIEYLVDNHGLDKSKIFYMPQYCESLYEDIKSKEHKGINYVFTGNVGRMQSVETIIRAADLVKNRGDIKIHIVGDGSDLNRCKELADSLQTNNIVFYGRRQIEDMPGFYSLADAMIITLSKDELISKTLPGKVQSYMAAGKPIVGAVDGEANEIIKESGCGYVCDSEDYESLALLFLNFDKKQAKIFSKASKDFYLKHFAKNTFFKKLNEVFMGEDL